MKAFTVMEEDKLIERERDGERERERETGTTGHQVRTSETSLMIVRMLEMYKQVNIMSDQQRLENSWRNNISICLASCRSTLTGK